MLTLAAIPFEWPTLLCAAFLAGAVDAVVGGGGLIQIPALFAALPENSAASLFGTNKCASVFGTLNASWRYAKQVSMPWRTILPATVAAFFCAYFGAWAVAWLPKEAIRPLILPLLIIAVLHTLKHKRFGERHAPTHSGRRELAYAALLGGAIGFYDGFFGPGTGSFLLFLFVRFFGFDFLHASASAKVVNVATNLAALLYFVPNGHFFPGLALAMAAANVTGSALGTGFALRYGSVFIRKVFLVVSTILICKFAWDTLGI